MGQFASRAFDGDPYIDIMRALPDKELVWWVQKVLWLAEGATIFEHFGKVYPNIFMHKCLHCNGAGIVTCPHCNGYKVKRAHAHAFRLSEHTTVGRLLAAADRKECEHCGTYCPWDQESEWQEEWNKWESRLAYYDRTYGDLFDEWYEDVIHEGRLDMDTESDLEPTASPSNQTQGAKISREVAKDQQRLKALMRRIGGHPYEHSHMLPYGVVDPSKPLTDNLTALGYNFFDLPPELHPEKFPEHLLDGSIHQFDKQIQAEYLILRNLDAAIQDLPKPAMFQPSAGTVACPACEGQAWQSHWVPNLARLLRCEQPFWARTFARMSPYWSTYSTTEGTPSYSPWMAATVAEERHQQEGQASSSTVTAAAAAAAQRPSWRRWLGEVPTQPPLLSPAQVQAAEQALKPGPLPQYPDELVDLAGARRPDGGVDYGRMLTALTSGLPSAPNYLRDGKQHPWPDAEDMAEVGALLQAAQPQVANTRRPAAVYGSEDPLAEDPSLALTPEQLSNQALRAPGGPLLGASVLQAKLQATDLLNPARLAARTLRDARQLGKASTPEEQEVLLKWAQSQPTLKLATSGAQ